MKNLLIIFLLLFLNCSKDNLPLNSKPEPEVGPNRYIKGKVLLDDQKTPSNCPVVFDNFIVGTFTDSLGNYEIFIPDSLLNLSGVFRVYYYLYDYDLDSLSIKIKNGNVVWGQEDVNDEGLLKTVSLKRIISMETTSDKYQYLVGERIKLSTKLTNKSNRLLKLYTSSYSWIIFFNTHSKQKSVISSGAATSDNPHIDPGFTYDLGGEPKIREIGKGYFIPIYSLNRGYSIPLSVKDFVWYSRFEYEKLITMGHSFFVFIDDSKNLSYPLVNVVHN